MVPKTFRENLRFRRNLIEQACQDFDFARELWAMCSRDILFYVNTFVWTYDPRKNPSALPFITYPFQDEALLEMRSCIGVEDMLIEKSRDMGASWICLIAMEWLFHFRELQTFLLVSRKEDYVDASGNSDSLFWKIDFIHKNQPAWLRPETERRRLHMRNVSNGSTFDGESTNGDVGRGGRRTALLLDEFAAVENGHSILSATADVTNTRIFNSTPKGTGNAFYDVRETGVRKLRFHWTRHPEKAAGLYTSKDGDLVVVDQDYQFAEGYDFLLDGKYRSPWYDRECGRRAHPMEIAQELDIDYLGSDFQFFDGVVLDELEKFSVRLPYHVGHLDYDPLTCMPLEFILEPKGKFLLWVNLDAHGHPPRDRSYVVGADISAGTGASNSSLAIVDKKTGEKVGEYTHARIRPEELAKVAVAICRWFKNPAGDGAYLIWEANGPGGQFGNAVVETGYRNIYWRRNEKSLSKKMSDTPGWYSNKENKLNLLGKYRRALASGDFINRSKQSLREAREYVFLPDGRVAHSRSATTIDPSGAKDNHGDRVIADAIANLGLEMVSDKPEVVQEVFLGTFAHRRKVYQDEKKSKLVW